MQLVRIGFILLPMPILICWSFELIEASRPEEPSEGAMTEHHLATLETEQRAASGRREWLLRLGGVPLLKVTVEQGMGGV
jgi:hypothetical protein